MKTIYQVAENVSFDSGGVRTVLVNLNNYLNSDNHYQSVILTNKKEPQDNYTLFPTDKAWNYSKEFKTYIHSNITRETLIHIHGVFMYTQYITGKLAKSKNIPYVITPHGMLEPWHLGEKKLKKQIYLALFLNTLLKNSKIVHAITPIEKDNLFKLTNHKNIVEIPNLLHFSKLPANLNYNPDEEYLLFLGRIHPKKGLDILIESMCKIQDKKIKLKIVGSENDYSPELRKRCQELGLENRVEFVGGVFGDEKYRLYANAKAFVAPSYSEAVGMVNLEAAACKTPVITTYNTGINPGWNGNGGIMINPVLTELTDAINQVTSWSTNERDERGVNLSAYVYQNYSWEKKGHLWNDLYDML